MTSPVPSPSSSPFRDASGYVVRPAAPRDLRHLAAVEDAGVVLFAEVFGDLTGDALAGPARSGGDRMDQPGTLLVAVPGSGAAGAGAVPVGFAHVVHVDGFAHLDQVSVHPDAGRRGLGTALVRAAMEEARWDGFDRISLCTYRDVAWNAPFYARLGFVEVARTEAFQRRLREREAALGLDRHGPRVVMSARLDRSS